MTINGSPPIIQEKRSFSSIKCSILLPFSLVFVRFQPGHVFLFITRKPPETPCIGFRGTAHSCANSPQSASVAAAAKAAATGPRRRSVARVGFVSDMRNSGELPFYDFRIANCFLSARRAIVKGEMCSFIHEVTPRAPTEPKIRGSRLRLTILGYILLTTI